MPSLPKGEITSLAHAEYQSPVEEGAISSLVPPEGDSNNPETLREERRSIAARFTNTIRSNFPRLFGRESTTREAALVGEIVYDLAAATQALEQLQVSTGTRPGAMGRRDFLKYLGVTAAALGLGLRRSSPNPEGGPTNVVSLVDETSSGSSTNSNRRGTGTPRTGSASAAQNSNPPATAEPEVVVNDDMEAARAGEFSEKFIPERAFKVGPLRFDLRKNPFTFYMPRGMTGRTDRDLASTLESIPVLGRGSDGASLPDEALDAFANPDTPENTTKVLSTVTEHSFNSRSAPENRPVVVIGHAGYGTKTGTEHPFNQLSAYVERMADQNEGRGKFFVMKQTVGGQAAYVVFRTVKNNVAAPGSFRMTATDGVSEEHLFFRSSATGLEDGDNAGLVLVTCRGRSDGWYDKAIVIARMEQVLMGDDLMAADEFNGKGLAAGYEQAGNMLLNASLNPAYGHELAGNRSAMKYLRETMRGGISSGLMDRLMRVEREFFDTDESSLRLRQRIETTQVYYGVGVNKVLNQGRGGSAATTLLEVDAVGKVHCRSLGRGTETVMSEDLALEEYLQMKQYSALVEDLSGYLGDVAGYDKPEKINQQFLNGGLRFMCEAIQRGVLKEQFVVDNNYYEMQVLGTKHGVEDIDGAVSEMLALAGNLVGRQLSAVEMLKPSVLKEVNEAFRKKYVGRIRGLSDKEVQFWNCFGMKRPQGSLDVKPIITELPQDSDS